MNPPETNLESPDVAVRELQEEVRSLRTVVVSALLVIIVLGLTLNIFLYRQASLISGQVTQAQALVDEYNGRSAPMARDFWLRLVEYRPDAR